jgi:hypothetical protein
MNFNAILTPPFGISQKDTENHAVKRAKKKQGIQVKKVVTTKFIK